MKKIINNKVYDTSTAKELGIDGGNYDNFSEWHETLFRKKTGEFFLYGEGGPASKYARSIGQNQWSGGSKIIPLNVESARKWAEEHLDADEYGEIFGMPDEDAEPVFIAAQIPADVAAQAKLKAAEQGISMTAYITDALRAYNG